MYEYKSWRKSSLGGIPICGADNAADCAANTKSYLESEGSPPFLVFQCDMSGATTVYDSEEDEDFNEFEGDKGFIW